MKTELSKQITTRFPKIFTDENLSLSIGDGWFDLFMITCVELQLFADVAGAQVIYQEVKEKYGSLTFRFYIDMKELKTGLDSVHCAKIIYDLVANASHASENICEYCGEYGEIREKRFGWLKAICKKCLEKENESKLD